MEREAPMHIDLQEDRVSSETDHGIPKDGPGADLERILFTAEDIQAKVEELSQEITRDYQGQPVLMVGVLNGCFPFMSDLIRSMSVHLEVDFMSVSSYGGGTRSSGIVRILKDLNENIQDRHVLLVEDIVDTGLTARYLIDNLRTRRPASVELCVLLDKRDARAEEVPVKYVGFECPDEFVVGYGLDYRQLYRNLPYIGVLKKEVFEGS
jgi:hypoxanthine phosphoribosyltransferase